MKGDKHEQSTFQGVETKLRVKHIYSGEEAEVRITAGSVCKQPRLEL